MKLIPRVLAQVILAVTLSLFAATTPTLGQSPTTPDWQATPDGKIAFDVASVKENKSGDPGGQDNLSQPGGDVEATNLTLEYLIEKAYFPYSPNGAPDIEFKLIGTAGWMDSLRFDIAARAGCNPTVQQKQLMLRSLLEDRFKLVVHRETRQLPIYALVLAKPGKIGPQLVPRSNNTNCLDPAAPARPKSGSAGVFVPICGAFYFMGPPQRRFASGSPGNTNVVLRGEFERISRAAGG